MAIEIVWAAGFSASCFHAVDAMLDHWSTHDAPPIEPQETPLADKTLVAAMHEAVVEFRGAVIARGSDLPTLMEHLCALSGGIKSNRELAIAALRKLRLTDNNQETINWLTRQIGNLERSFTKALPKVVKDLETRSLPLRTAWQAKGPGLMGEIGRRTDPQLIVSRAEVVLVHPIRGGDGLAHLAYNSVRLESVLTNAEEQLPEALRLGWLLSQLNLEVPMFGERVHGSRLPLMAKLAMLPPTLAAGEDLDFAPFNRDLIARALRYWRIELNDPDQVADTVMNWWQTYEQGRPPFAIALAALDQMLGEQVPQESA